MEQLELLLNYDQISKLDVLEQHRAFEEYISSQNQRRFIWRKRQYQDSVFDTGRPLSWYRRQQQEGASQRIIPYDLPALKHLAPGRRTRYSRRHSRQTFTPNFLSGERTGSCTGDDSRESDCENRHEYRSLRSLERGNGQD